jgi:Tol biopolymer transport system component
MRRSTWLTMVAVIAVLLVAAQAHPRSGWGRTKDAGNVLRVSRVNVSTGGRAANGQTFGAVLSASGRYVAFASAASTLVRKDRNEASDIFVRNLRTSRTSRVSVSSVGMESDGASMKPSISADGRVVAFPSSATNLVGRDRNGVQDIFARDRAIGTTVRVSMGDGGEANALSLASLVSADGSAIVFSSEASNLVPGDRNGTLDVFVADRATRRLRRVSVGAEGESRNRSEASSVDARGLVVGFRSYASNLVRGDRNGRADVFVYDRRQGRTERVNTSSSGVEADGVTFRGMVSGNGRFVGFRSRANNLVPGDTNNALDVFVYDRAKGTTTRVSVAADGAEADADGFGRSARENMFMSRPFLSANGRYIAFTSRAPNLVEGDENGTSDVFVHDLVTGRTTRVSVSADGEEANGDSFVSGISADGHVVAFTSLADNLVARDRNRRKDVFVAWLDLEPRSFAAHRHTFPALHR